MSASLAARHRSILGALEAYAYICIPLDGCLVKLARKLIRVLGLIPNAVLLLLATHVLGTHAADCARSKVKLQVSRGLYAVVESVSTYFQ